MKIIDFKSLLIGILGTVLIMILKGQTSFMMNPYQVQCVPMEDTIGMGYVACRLFDQRVLSKIIGTSKPELLFTEREFWEFYKPEDLLP